MADDGTRWSHTSGEAEALNKMTTNYDMMKSSAESFKRGKEERKKQREEREKEGKDAKEKDAKEKEAKEKEAKEKEAREKGQGK